MTTSRSLFLAGALALGVAVAVPAAPPATAAAKRPSVAESAPVLPFIDDDLPRALARARERSLPLFVESWAPW
jgi:hypothetical protein